MTEVDGGGMIATRTSMKTPPSTATRKSYEHLSRSEEEALVLAWQTKRDKRAIDVLVRRHKGIVHLIYRRRFSRYTHIAEEDLIQEGCIGVVDAVTAFDASLGTRLSTLVGACAWTRMSNVAKNTLGIVKVVRSPETSHVFFKGISAKHCLQARGVEPTDKAVADFLGVDERDVVAVRNALATQPFHDVDAGYTDGDDVGDRRIVARYDALRSESHEGTVADKTFDSAQRRALKEAMACLSNIERQVICARFLRDEPLLLREVGKKLGICGERARQLEARAIRKIKNYCRASVPDLFE